MTTSTTQLRAPGVSFRQPAPRRVLDAVRLDTCAFAGITRRGPCRQSADDPDAPGAVRRTVPLLVESWEEFAWRFGGLAGPGLLPHAVAAFFENGGSRAYVLRIVHGYGDAADDHGRATSQLDGLTAVSTTGPPTVVAADEGVWGNGLQARGVFRLAPVRSVPSVLPSGGDRLPLPPGNRLPVGTLLQATTIGGGVHLRWVAAVEADRFGAATAVLDTELPSTTRALAAVTVDLVLRLPDEAIVERHDRLGLDPAHPRFVGDVLADESVLLRLEERTGRLDPIGLGVTAEVTAPAFAGGEDRTVDVTARDLLDNGWIPGDAPGEGIHAITDHTDIGMLCVPDLYAPFPPVEDEPVVDPPSVAGAAFAVCVDVADAPRQGRRPDLLAGLRLDPHDPHELEEIIELQQDLVTLAEQLRAPVALLDVPPGLTVPAVRSWQARFDSSYAAAYHPWLKVPSGDRLATTAPSAAAAGIIAKRELRDGVPTGPANEIVQGAVDVTDPVGPPGHGELHHLGVNVLVRERDGVRLTGARTLSRDRTLHQLSVRRLMVLIRLTLEQRMRWVTFEPNHHLLRAELRHLTRTFLRGLSRQGAFRGATEAESFFVRCDDTTNPPAIVDAGLLVAEIGVAPAHPMEFLEVTLAFDGDATVRAEETHAR